MASEQQFVTRHKIESQPMCDVPPEQYPAVLRDMIRHEDDVTNHRIMWLLVVQGLLVNAYVTTRADLLAARGVTITGILVSLSAFVLLYKSYQARGYLNFLGGLAKEGKLREQYLRLDGWPRKRLRYWRRSAWACPWLSRGSDLFEPYLSLPVIVVAAWIFLLIRPWMKQLSLAVTLGIAMIVTAVIFFLFCTVWVLSERKDENEGAD